MSAEATSEPAGSPADQEVWNGGATPGEKWTGGAEPGEKWTGGAEPPRTGRESGRRGSPTQSGSIGATAQAPSFAETVAKDHGDEYGAWVKSKGWSGLADMMKSHRDTEAFVKFPADRLLKLPENQDDPAAMDEVYRRLGRPDSAEEYDVAVPEGLPDGFWNQDYAANMAERAHALGLTKAQMQGLVEAQIDYAAMQGEAEERAAEAAIANLEMEMREDWGTAYESNLSLARRGAKLAGDGEKEDINTLLGSKRAMQFWARLGGMMAEGTMPYEAGGSGQDVQAEINRIEGSPEFRSYLDKAAAGRRGAYTDEERALVAQRSALYGKL